MKVLLLFVFSDHRITCTDTLHVYFWPVCRFVFLLLLQSSTYESVVYHIPFLALRGLWEAILWTAFIVLVCYITVAVFRKCLCSSLETKSICRELGSLGPQGRFKSTDWECIYIYIYIRPWTEQGNFIKIQVFWDVMLCCWQKVPDILKDHIYYDSTFTGNHLPTNTPSHPSSCKSSSTLLCIGVSLELLHLQPETEVFLKMFCSSINN